MPEKASKLTELAAKIDYECRGHKVSAGILCDAQIRWRVREQDMISPCLLHTVREHGVSAGITHHGYDARLGRRFLTFREPIHKFRTHCTTLDKLEEEIRRESSIVNDERFTASQIELAKAYIIEPGVTQFDAKDFIEDYIEGDNAYILYPLKSVLATTQEWFKIPNDIHCTVVGKSTMARLFVHPLTTPLEAGWEGKITLEIVNLGPRPVMLRPSMGIIQVEFHAVDIPDETYADKGGKYNKQDDVEIAKWA